MVPKRATESMLVAALPCFVAPWRYSGDKAWGAMLAAAGEPE